MVQGVAEVHPVSSSAQLTLLPWLLGWQPPADRTRFAAGLHAGSAVGLALALRADLAALGTTDRRRLVLSALPAAAAGAVAQDVVERRLGGPRPTAAALALGGLALSWADSRAERRTGPDRGSAGAADVGVAALAQVAALAPGVSRTGATLTALRARGVDRASGYRLSLLMSLPVTLGAAGLTAVRGRALPPALPTALAGGSAYLSTRLLRPSRGTVTAAVAYRLLLAAAVLARRPSPTHEERG